MLNFKTGRTYKDTDGNDWVFCCYRSGYVYPYLFKDKQEDLKAFGEYADTLVVTEWDNGNGIRIPFVEEKERDWVVGESYEAYNVISKNIQRLKLQKIAECDGKNTVFFLDQPFWESEEIALLGGWIVFKSGIPKELKDKLKNKENLNNKRKCFQKGQIYGTLSGTKWKFIKRAKVSGGLVAIFDQEGIEGNSHLFNLYRLNNIEFILSNNNIYLCSDESIRNEDVHKAERVLQ